MRKTCRQYSLIELSQRFESCTQVCDQKLRLLPCGKVATFVELVIIDEFRIRLLCPASRCLVEFFGKSAHCCRDRNVFRSEKWKLAFPKQAILGNCRIRKPV